VSMSVGAVPPETRYVTVGDADVSYQVFGDGPTDLLYFAGLGSNWDAFWHLPGLSEFVTRLSSFCRVIVFDRRGIGSSDRIAQNVISTWEDLSEDAGAVLDAAGSKQAAIYATSEAGPMALLFSAMHPDRVSALVFYCSYARRMVADDYPIGLSAETIDLIVGAVRESWGSADFARSLLPERSALVENLACICRLSATPRNAAAQFDYLLRHLDARRALPLIKVPTLVVHARDAVFLSVEESRYHAEHIEGARFLEIPGREAGPWGDEADMMAGEISELLTGQRPLEIDRVLTTILFTDTVDSTATAAALGDRSWRSVLDSHDHVVREQLRRFRGQEINTTGDGFVAIFDGPARAIRCARAVAEATEAVGVKVRVGLHTGECELRGNDFGGLAVHIAARVGALAGPNEVLVSSTVKDLVVGSGIEFADRGEHELKGVPGTWRLFAVTG
jgi:class 3 adenylate cyclase